MAAAETVAKQLQFSPISQAHNTDQASFPGLQQVQQRLDARADWGTAPAAVADGNVNGNSNGRGFMLKAPTDDEDDEEVEDAQQPQQQQQQQQLSPSSGPNGLTTAPYDQQQQQEQQQEQQQLFTFGAGPGPGPSSSSHHPSPVESMLWEHTRQLQAHAVRQADVKQQQLHSQLHHVEQQLAHELHEVQQHVARKRARAAAEDELHARARMQERHRKLQEVQQQQAQLQAAHATALQEAHKQQAEAENKRRAQAAAAAAAAAAVQAEQQRQEEERRKQQEAAAAAAAQARAEAKQQAAQQQQQQQPPPAAAAAGAAGGGAAAPTQQQGLARTSAGALEYEAQLRAKLDAAEASAAVLTSKPELKAARRAVEKKITMWVSQISGTQMQVKAKAMQLVELINSCSSQEERSLAFVTLCNRMLSQCDVQVLRIGSFAFPLAYVCVAVGAAVPEFMELLLAKLQQACPLLVPKHTKRAPGASDADYFQGLGYRLIDDPKQAGVKRLENADEYVARMSAMVLLYASIVQTESAGNPLPLAHGWTWMARCLNHMPPNRSCAAALMAFLSHAGYRMAAVYGRQFHKLLQHLATHYLPALEAKAEKNANLRAVATRLQTYVGGRGYLKDPEGRTLKRVDESETIHA